MIKSSAIHSKKINKSAIVIKSDTPAPLVCPYNDFLPTEPIVSYAEEIQRTKLRDDFPFLFEPNCPDELKILVSDKITAFHNYTKAHERLFTAKDNSEMLVAVRDTVENFLNNRLIFAELDHYKKTGKLLKKHPYFKRKRRQEEIQKMSAGALAKLKEQLEMNIWRNKKLIDKEPGHRLTGDRLDRINDYEHSLTFVNSLLENR